MIAVAGLRGVRRGVRARLRARSRTRLAAVSARDGGLAARACSSSTACRPRTAGGRTSSATRARSQQIADARAAAARASAVVELGPGLGHLTRALLATGAQVMAVERDRDMVAVLEEREAPGRCTVVAANAADVDFAEVAGRRPGRGGRATCRTTSPARSSSRCWSSARRDAARSSPSSRRWWTRLARAARGRATTGCSRCCWGCTSTSSSCSTLPAQLFHPPPKVDSAVVRLDAAASARAPR